MGTFGMVYMAPGTYRGGVDFIEWHRLTIRGATDENGTCLDPAAVIIDNGRAGSSTIVVQDHATLLVNCLTLRASGENINFLAARQLAIMDYGNLRFDAAPGGSIATIASPSDGASMNCYGDLWFDAPAHSYMLAASGRANLGCKHHLAEGANLGAALIVSDGAAVAAQNAVWDGQSGGVPYIVDAGVLNIGKNTPPGSSPGQIYNGGIVK